MKDRGPLISTLLLLLFGFGWFRLAAQVPISVDSVAGIPWDQVTIEQARSFFPESSITREGPPGTAYIVGSGCVQLPGSSHIEFESTGVHFIFERPDTAGRQLLGQVQVFRRGAVLTPSKLDVGDSFLPQLDSNSANLHPAQFSGRAYLQVNEGGVLFYCTPPSLKRVERGKSVKVKHITVRKGQ